MHLSILSTVFTLATLAVALSPQAPIGPLNRADQTPLSCTIKLPTSYQQIAQDYPSTPFPQNRVFNVSQSESGSANVDTLIRFAGIPSGAYGCQVAMSFTNQYPIHSSGKTQVNVYALSNDISGSDTYSTYFPSGGRGTPKGSYLWATTTITGQRAVLNSENCRPTLGFLFRIASENGAGAVTFVDAGNNLQGIGGFYLSYNC